VTYFVIYFIVFVLNLTGLELMKLFMDLSKTYETEIKHFLNSKRYLILIKPSKKSQEWTICYFLIKF